ASRPGAANSRDVEWRAASGYVPRCGSSIWSVGGHHRDGDASASLCLFEGLTVPFPVGDLAERLAPLLPASRDADRIPEGKDRQQIQRGGDGEERLDVLQPAEA